jgi:glycosyltransferase involved in cell wall biosynthesis
MNILFLTLLDISDENQNPIYSDLLNYFNKQDHKIYAVCPTERKHQEETNLLNKNGINILKVKIGNITKANILEKGISTLLIENKYLSAIKSHFSNVKFDLVLYSTPPITFGKVVKYIKTRDQAKSYLLLKDIFPQNAVDLEMFSKKSLFYKFFRTKEKSLYNESDYIGCMSQANVDFVIKNNPFIDPSKVEVCPNSIEPFVINIEKDSKDKIKSKYNIPLDKTVFVYGGNLGKPQGINFLMECLKSNKNNEESYFLIVGSGTEYNRLKKFLETEKIPNAMLFAYLPKDDYKMLVSSCDVGLIFLDKRFTIPNFPSRILSYMQASMPIIAATDKSTDLGNVIESGNFGLWCESGNTQSFNESVNKLTLDNHLRTTMGKSAEEFLRKYYTVENSYNIIMEHFERERANV